MNNQYWPKLAPDCAGVNAYRATSESVARMPAFSAALTSEKRTVLPEVYSLAPWAKRPTSKDKQMHMASGGVETITGLQRLRRLDLDGLFENDVG